MQNTLIDEDELKAKLKYERRGDVVRFLQQNRIPYFYGKAGSPVTTLGAIESVLIGNTERESCELL